MKRESEKRIVKVNFVKQKLFKSEKKIIKVNTTETSLVGPLWGERVGGSVRGRRHKIPEKQQICSKTQQIEQAKGVQENLRENLFWNKISKLDDETSFREK